jgi:hypothetical protein
MSAKITRRQHQKNGILLPSNQTERRRATRTEKHGITAVQKHAHLPKVHPADYVNRRQVNRRFGERKNG